MEIWKKLLSVGMLTLSLFERLTDVQPEELRKGKRSDTMRIKMSQKKAHWEKQEQNTKNLALKKLSGVFPEAKSRKLI